jgi:hypothetical protein
LGGLIILKNLLFCKFSFKEKKKEVVTKEFFFKYFFHKMPRICDLKKSLKRTKVSSAKLPIIDEDSY